MVRIIRREEVLCICQAREKDLILREFLFRLIEKLFLTVFKCGCVDLVNSKFQIFPAALQIIGRRRYLLYAKNKRLKFLKALNIFAVQSDAFIACESVKKLYVCRFIKNSLGIVLTVYINEQRRYFS